MKLEDYFVIDGTYELQDGVYNVKGCVSLNRFVKKLPCNFGKVSGSFWCHNNSLTSLEGCPSWVGVNFNCIYNKLTSLEGVPNYVGGNFWCNINKLTSLECAPNYVGGRFYCDEDLHNTKEYRQYLIMDELRK